jgi:hypothetical protein
MFPLINDAANIFCDGWNDVFHMCTFSAEKYRGGYKTIVYYMVYILLLWSECIMMLSKSLYIYVYIYVNI